MKKLFAFVFGFLFVVCPFVVQAEDVDVIPQKEIARAPSIDLISEEAITYLLGEDMYQGTHSWKGNKVSTKFNYEMEKKK